MDTRWPGVTTEKKQTVFVMDKVQAKQLSSQLKDFIWRTIAPRLKKLGRTGALDENTDIFQGLNQFVLPSFYNNNLIFYF